METKQAKSHDVRNRAEQFKEATDNGYEFKRRQHPNEEGYLWIWSDLFTPEGLDSPVWKFEVFDMFLRCFSPLALQPDYQGGLLMGSQVYGPGKEGEDNWCSWHGWWDAQTFRNYYLHYNMEGFADVGKQGLGEYAIAAHAINQTNELYEHFVTWPEQDALLIGAIDNVAGE